MLDFTIEEIIKTVKKEFPDEPGDVRVCYNYSTSSMFAFALFTDGESEERIILDDIGIINHYGLPIKVQRAKPLTK